MANPAIKTVSIVGAGNLATHLAVGLNERGYDIKEIWSKDSTNAAILAKVVEASTCINLSDLNTDVDLVIVSVKDDAIEEVVKLLPTKLHSVIHTSGSLDMKVLNVGFENIGVLYPLQSFNKNEMADWRVVPVCVEANNDKFTNLLFELAKTLSNQVEYLNSTQRGQLHIAAVFANNFSNYLFSLAYEIAVKQHLPFSLLIPLIHQTAHRLSNENPFNLQTGPAQRNDVAVIKKHLEQLASNKNAQEVYEFLSNEIIKKGRN